MKKENTIDNKNIKEEVLKNLWSIFLVSISSIDDILRIYLITTSFEGQSVKQYFLLLGVMDIFYTFPSLFKYKLLVIRRQEHKGFKALILVALIFYIGLVVGFKKHVVTIVFLGYNILWMYKQVATDKMIEDKQNPIVMFIITGWLSLFTLFLIIKVNKSILYVLPVHYSIYLVSAIADCTMILLLTKKISGYGLKGLWYKGFNIKEEIKEFVRSIRLGINIFVQSFIWNITDLILVYLNTTKLVVIYKSLRELANVLIDATKHVIFKKLQIFAKLNYSMFSRDLVLGEVLMLSLITIIPLSYSYALGYDMKFALAFTISTVLVNFISFLRTPMLVKLAVSAKYRYTLIGSTLDMVVVTIAKLTGSYIILSTLHPIAGLLNTGSNYLGYKRNKKEIKEMTIKNINYEL